MTRAFQGFIIFSRERESKQQYTNVNIILSKIIHRVPKSKRKQRTRCVTCYVNIIIVYILRNLNYVYTILVCSRKLVGINCIIDDALTINAHSYTCQ